MVTVFVHWESVYRTPEIRIHFNTVEIQNLDTSGFGMVELCIFLMIQFLNGLDFTIPELDYFEFNIINP